MPTPRTKDEWSSIFAAGNSKARTIVTMATRNAGTIGIIERITDEGVVVDFGNGPQLYSFTEIFPITSRRGMTQARHGLVHRTIQEARTATHNAIRAALGANAPSPFQRIRYGMVARRADGAPCSDAYRLEAFPSRRQILHLVERHRACVAIYLNLEYCGFTSISAMRKGVPDINRSASIMLWCRPKD